MAEDLKEQFDQIQAEIESLAQQIAQVEVNLFTQATSGENTEVLEESLKVLDLCFDDARQRKRTVLQQLRSALGVSINGNT